MAELRKYGSATTILFPLIDRDAADFHDAQITFAAGDTKISKDEGVFADTADDPAHEGNGVFSLALTAAELQAARIIVTVRDQSPTKEWEDQAVLIETYGDAGAQHEFDLDAAVQDVNITTVAVAALEAIADKVLARPISSVEPAAVFRTLYGAVSSLVNRRRINAGNIDVFKTDDATNLASLAITEDPAQSPISELDP